MGREGFKIIPPSLPDTGREVVFYDDGVPGEWLRMIRNSPCLNVSDYAGGDLPDALAAPASVVLSPFHDAGDSDA